MKQLTIVIAVLAISICVCNPNHLLAQTGNNRVPLASTKGGKWTIRWDRSDDFNSEAVDYIRVWERAK